MNLEDAIVVEIAATEAAKQVAAALDAPPAHHALSPSSMKYRAICPGFDQDSTGDTTHADAGTLAHRAAEIEDASIVTDPEYRAAAERCIEVARKIRAGAIETHKEVRLSILGGLTFGTSDEVSIKPNGLCEMLDFKFGMGAVDEPKDNWQAYSYCIGVFERWPQVQSVRAWFILPRRDEIMQHTFHRSQLPELQLKVKTVIERAKLYRETKDPSLLNRTIEGCLYCAHKATCPKSTEYALATARRYAPLELVDEIHSSQITDPSKMVQLLEAKRVLAKMVDSIDTHAKKMAEEQGGLYANGKLVYELASRSGVRKLRKDKIADAVDIFRQHLEDGEILAESDISLTGVLDRIAQKAERGQKGKLRGAVEAALSEAEAITSGEPTTYLRRVKS